MPNTLSLSRLLASLSYALDLTEGQPMGHAIRACLIGLRLAQELHLTENERVDLHLASLLKDAGCSSNAARMYSLFGGDEIVAKGDSKVRDWCRASEAVKFALRHAAPHESLFKRVRQLRLLSQQPVRVMDVLTEARCTRGAAIATQLGLSPQVSETIHALDEHWNGEGAPYHRQGEEIPRLARIACLAQTMEVFFTTYGTTAAYRVIQERSGTWFEPDLVRAAQSFAEEATFWEALSSRPEELLRAMTSPLLQDRASEAGIDSVCAAFAQIVDAKSSFTGEHSGRVTEYADQLALLLGLGAERRRTLRHAALLHDLGKLAIPNQILDKPAKLTQKEFKLIQKHPYYTKMILDQIPGFGRISAVAAAHHEKLNGRGYYQGLTEEHLDQEMRILAVADILDALTAARPYREAMALEQALAILKAESGTALDADCVAAVPRVVLTGSERWVSSRAA